MLAGKTFYEREHTTPLYPRNRRRQTQEMKLLSGFLLTGMILLVFKRNNWRENGHLVFFGFAVNEMFDRSIFAEHCFLTVG